MDVRQEGNVKVYGIPYSEHSSFTELRDCVAALRPSKLVPTVNATNHAAAETIISRFAVCPYFTHIACCWQTSKINSFQTYLGVDHYTPGREAWEELLQASSP